MAMLTGSPQLTVTDIWGNAVELMPTGGVAIFQVDEFPRFIDLGANSHIQLMNGTGTAYFVSANKRAAYKIVSRDADNSVAFHLENNQKIFSNHIAGKLVFNIWPETFADVVTEKDPFAYDIGPYNSSEVTCANFENQFIPDDAQTMKELCEVSVDIVSGDRRMGFLTLPVYYSPKLRTEEK
jgi:hypothetical protein